MNTLKEKQISCPYCGESISVLVDCSVAEQNYIEDCQVCCCPIILDLSIDENGDVSARVSAENE